jgi:hypothetical protein
MKRFALLVVAIALCAVAGRAASGPYNATIVVTPNDLARCGPPPAAPSCGAAHSDRKWFFYDDVKDLIDNTMGSFVICQYGPCPYYDGAGAPPPLGVGSVQISTVLSRRPNLATYQFGGIRLVDITTLGYSTYNPSAGNKTDPTRAGYLQFNVDFTGTSTAFQRRLTFVPRNNPPVLQDQWQAWDAIDGPVPGSKTALWTYSGASWPGLCAAPGTTPKTWGMILTCYPNSRILPGDSFLGIRVGEPYGDGYTGNIDAFKFGTAAGTITFDFEPYGCSSAHGDGEMNGNHGGNAHVHFNKNGCPGKDGGVDEADNVQHSDPGSGTDFKSTNITSAAFAVDEGRQAVTIVGIGVNNGLPVGFTMIAVDNGNLAPGVFTLVLTDGYSITGSLTNGAIVIP